VEADAIVRAVSAPRVEALNPQLAGLHGTLGQVIGAHTGVHWTGTSHTSDLAPTLAIGPGAERFAGVMHHAEVFPILMGLLGIDHVNPTMTPKEAQRHVAASRNEVHWV